MNDIMVDLETLGRAAGCKVLSIGAVPFGPSGLGSSEFYVAIDEDSQPWLHEDPDTRAWWMKQSADARRVFTDPSKVPLPVALERFSQWCQSIASRVKLNCWGNGSEFDNSILIAAYRHPGVTAPLPWTWGARCFRTLKNLGRKIPFERQGTHHNALDDARTQAEHAVRIMNTYDLWPR